MPEKGKIDITILFVGDKGVGKTQLINTLCNKPFINKYNCTIGIDSKQHTMGRFNVNMWDPAGEKKYVPIIHPYYKSSDLIVFCLDLTLPESLDRLQDFVDEANNIKSTYAAFWLVGTKSDSVTKISEDKIKSFIEKNQIEYYLKVSAKNGTNLENLSAKIIDFAEKNELIERIYSKILELKNQVDIWCIFGGKNICENDGTSFHLPMGAAQMYQDYKLYKQNQFSENELLKRWQEHLYYSTKRSSGLLFKRHPNTTLFYQDSLIWIDRKLKSEYSPKRRVCGC